MSNERIKKIRLSEPEPITIRFHGSTKPSKHKVDLRQNFNPLENASTYHPQTEGDFLHLNDELESIEIENPLPVSKKPKKEKKGDEESILKTKLCVARTQLYLHIKQMAGFAIVIVLLLLPFGGINIWERIKAQSGVILTEGRAAQSNFQNASAKLIAGDFAEAGKEFSKTLAALENIRSNLEHIKNLLPVLPGKSLALQVERLIDGTKSTSLALLNLSQALHTLSEQNLSDTTPVEFIDHINSILSVTAPRLKDASENFKDIEVQSFPEPYIETIALAKDFFPSLELDLNKIMSVNQLIKSILGQKTMKRYLIIFQNDAELRPTGGFIGSLALLTVNEGRITEMEIPGGGPYDIQGSQEAYIKPPQPLMLVNKRWELQDANWFPHFPQSAKHIIRLWEKADQPTVDGVIAVNAQFVEQLMALVPPIELPAYNTTVTAENFRQVTQTKVELEYDQKANQPKKFIADLAPKIFKELADKKDTQSIIQLLLLIPEGFEQNNIQMYLSDPDMQKVAEVLNIDGGIVDTESSSDYVFVVNTNLGGAKTDYVIEQTLHHKAEIQDNGDVINTVTIKRTHKGVEGEVFYGVPNVNYIRIYVPQGSQLVSSSGFTLPPEEHFNVPEEWYQDEENVKDFESSGVYDTDAGTFIGREFGKTVFANWVNTNPQETSEIKFTYKLPFKLFPHENKETILDKIIRAAMRAPKKILGYNLYVQKQAGVKQKFVRSTVVLPHGFELKWSTDTFNKDSSGALSIDMPHDRDAFIAIAAALE